MSTAKCGSGWLPPRSGGYSPGKESTPASKQISSSAKPPKGGAGIGKAQDRGSR